ncbi:hypothetical protein V6N13_094925 [Hibiscus sabdariffa]
MFNFDPTSLVAKVFGVADDIEVGNTRPFYLSHVEDPTSFEFFPEEQIRDIPFSSEALPQLLRFFSFSDDSPQALAMKQTLELCEAEPPKGEASPLFPWPVDANFYLFHLASRTRAGRCDATNFEFPRLKPLSTESDIIGIP